ncbi:PaaI family thioesterase [Inquilinus limosus]|uniref:Aromatic compound degradation protein PaaI n=1 Tax=Inquilinus limosus MP06 TaxID=1398085 RepID=A0A0A0D5K7_9PROT|nr:PaaI family thioesterase [Inquilinus limosus]KGM33344.1 aromatic compound degradation protein PaaI [Inquilinus limosus MP06]
MDSTEPVLRERVVRWQDPRALAAAGRGMSGRDFLQALADGRLPPPPIADLVGFTLTEIGDGRVVLTLEPDESHYNPIGSMHGGVIATVLDTVMGCAVHTTLPAGRGYTTLEIKVNYVRAVVAGAGPVQAIGRVIHAGRQTAVAEATLVDGRDRVLAHASTTCLIFGLPAADAT